jgi:hypothetical protein
MISVITVPIIVIAIFISLSFAYLVANRWADLRIAAALEQIARDEDNS